MNTSKRDTQAERRLRRLVIRATAFQRFAASTLTNHATGAFFDLWVFLERLNFRRISCQFAFRFNRSCFNTHICDPNAQLTRTTIPCLAGMSQHYIRAFCDTGISLGKRSRVYTVPSVDWLHVTGRNATPEPGRLNYILDGSAEGLL